MPQKVKTVRSGMKTRDKKPPPNKVLSTSSLLCNQEKDESNTLKTPSKTELDVPSNIINRETSLNGLEKVVETKNTDTKSSSTESESDHQVQLVGDLVWSKIPGHSWWPSMISYDPCDAIYFTKSKNGKDVSKFHVQFFGDKSLRGWVSKSSIMEYKGKEHFTSLPSKLKSKLPSPKQLASWENAIIQADEALDVGRKDRILKFTYRYDDVPKKADKPVKNSKNIDTDKSKQAQNVKVNKSKKRKDVLKELHTETNHAPFNENNSDSGIEDLDTASDETMDEPANKRKRKQKEYSDYHTGVEMNIAIKSTTWKPMPSLNDVKLSPQKRQSPTKSNLPKIDEPPVKEKENSAGKNRRSKRDIKANADCLANYISIKESADFTNIKPLKDKITKTNDKQVSKKATKHKDKQLELAPDSIEATASETDIEEKNIKIKKEEVLVKKEERATERATFCSICEGLTGDLIPCCGQCFRYFHFDCLGLGSKPKFDFICDECQTGRHVCFQCKETGDLVKCSQVNCGKFYHSHCIDELLDKEAKPANGGSRFFCPHHSCKVCNKTKSSTKTDTAPSKCALKLVKCIRCPTAYHQRTCFIAGCSVLTAQYMICDQHYDHTKKSKGKNHFNVTWCFVCSHGGSLVCCDTCPASFHPECTDDLHGVPEGAWRCKDCKEHNKPKYGEIVWVKFGVYRWWPGQICFPEEVPERILKLPHSLGEFPVMFFGSSDYCWINSGRVFRYEEGDKGGKLKKSNSLGNYFQKALQEAKVAFEEFKKEQAQLTESLDKRKSRKPPSYKSIKTNQPVNCVRTVLDRSEWPVCECSGKEGCTGESECLNRMLYFECNSKTCKAGPACNNQRMQKYQSKSVKTYKCEGKGWGLKAGEDIKIGDFVVEYVGELIDEETCQQRVKEYHEKEISDYYFLTIDRDNIIDAYPKGNLSRFMNHSCDPNCETQKWTVNGEVRVGLFASRDIKQDDELSFNYHLDSLGNEKKQCKCGAGNCSGYLGVKPKSRHAISVAEKAKNKKQKEKERRKQKKEKMQKMVHEDDCFVCGDGGDLILCSRGKCIKSYHLKCLSLEKIPRGKWECPWHFCDECGKIGKVMCALCTNSYCASHQDGEMFPLRENITVCSHHTEDEFKELLLTLDRRQNNAVDTQESSDASEMDANNNQIETKVVEKEEPRIEIEKKTKQVVNKRKNDNKATPGDSVPLKKKVKMAKDDVKIVVKNSSKKPRSKTRK